MCCVDVAVAVVERVRVSMRLVVGLWRMRSVQWLIDWLIDWLPFVSSLLSRDHGAVQRRGVWDQSGAMMIVFDLESCGSSLSSLTIRLMARFIASHWSHLTPCVLHCFADSTKELEWMKSINQAVSSNSIVLKSSSPLFNSRDVVATRSQSTTRALRLDSTQWERRRQRQRQAIERDMVLEQKVRERKRERESDNRMSMQSWSTVWACDCLSLFFCFFFFFFGAFFFKLKPEWKCGLKKRVKLDTQLTCVNFDSLEPKLVNWSRSPLYEICFNPTWKKSTFANQRKSKIQKKQSITTTFTNYIHTQNMHKQHTQRQSTSLNTKFNSLESVGSPCLLLHTAPHSLSVQSHSQVPIDFSSNVHHFGRSIPHFVRLMLKRMNPSTKKCNVQVDCIKTAVQGMHLDPHCEPWSICWITFAPVDKIVPNFLCHVCMPFFYHIVMKQSHKHQKCIFDMSVKWQNEPWNRSP